MSSIQFWETIKQNLKAKNTNNKLMSTWFDPTKLLNVQKNDEKCCFQLGVPTDLHKYWISENFYDRICQEISSVYKDSFSVELIVTGDDTSFNIQNQSADPRALRQAMTNNSAPKIKHSQPTTQIKSTTTLREKHSSLNPDYTFSTFVVGKNSEFVHAASYSIAENPGAEGYSPLFILGPTGMGKTHLMNAIGNHLQESKPHFKIMYLSSERFLNEFVSSIRRAEMDKFRKKYREESDILLIDDVQFLGHKEGVQEEFFHTLNHYSQNKRQVIVASDRMPKEIKGLEDRIRTRLEGGLIADISMPDIETRVAILRYKSEKKLISIPEEVIQYIAKISKRSIRELEGNLNKVKMFSELRGISITLDVAKEILGSHDESSNLTVEEIQRLVASQFKVRVNELKSASRYKPILMARQVSMYLIKKYLNKSLQEIGRAFGGRDHTTVINALRKIENQQPKDSDLRNNISELERQIQNITGV